MSYSPLVNLAMIKREILWLVSRVLEMTSEQETKFQMFSYIWCVGQGAVALENIPIPLEATWLTLDSIALSPP